LQRHWNFASPADYIVPVALSFAELLGTADLSRIRRCKNPECPLIFMIRARALHATGAALTSAETSCEWQPSVKDTLIDPDKSKFRAVHKIFCERRAPRAAKTGLHPKNQRSVANTGRPCLDSRGNPDTSPTYFSGQQVTGTTLPPYLNQTSVVQDLYMMSHGSSGTVDSAHNSPTVICWSK